MKPRAVLVTPRRCGIAQRDRVQSQPLRRVQRFVDAIRDGGAIGGSHYDYATTESGLWPILDDVNG
jgi:hypothetical protein